MHAQVVVTHLDFNSFSAMILSLFTSADRCFSSVILFSSSNDFFARSGDDSFCIHTGMHTRFRVHNQSQANLYDNSAHTSCNERRGGVDTGELTLDRGVMCSSASGLSAVLNTTPDLCLDGVAASTTYDCNINRRSIHQYFNAYTRLNAR